MGVAQLILALALATPPAPPPFQEGDPVAEVAALRAEGRFREAFEVATHVADPGLSARLEAEVRWYAGDLDGALAAVREGLVAAPGDTLLAWLGTRLALDLDRAAAARRLLSELETAVGEPGFQATLDGEGRSWWDAELVRLEGAVVAAAAALDERDAALGRARWAASIAALVGLALGVLLARVPRRDRDEESGGRAAGASSRAV